MVVSERMKELQKSKWPILVGIPVTNKCNESCSFCLRGKIEQKALKIGEDLSVEKFRQICDKISGKAAWINISAGYGESLLHPDINRLVDTAQSNHLKVLCYTNGKIIEQSMDIIRKVDKCVISVNQNSFKDTILEEIEKLSPKEREGIIFSLLVNLEENTMIFMEKIMKFCIKNRVLLELHWMFNLTGCIEKPIIIMKDELQYIKQNFLSNTIHMPSLTAYSFIHCQDPWRSLYFDKEGYLRKCCIFYDSIKEYNIFQDNLEDIWNSKQLEAQRKFFLEGNHYDLCKGCPGGFGLPKELCN